MKTPTPVLAVISHDVKDYDEWRKYFDANEPFRVQNGIMQSDVFRCPEHPNKVIVTQHYATVAEARAFLSRPEWKDNMQKAGVVSKPDVILGISA